MRLLPRTAAVGFATAAAVTAATTLICQTSAFTPTTRDVSHHPFPSSTTTSSSPSSSRPPLSLTWQPWGTSTATSITRRWGKYQRKKKGSWKQSWTPEQTGGGGSGITSSSSSSGYLDALSGNTNKPAASGGGGPASDAQATSKNKGGDDGVYLDPFNSEGHVLSDKKVSGPSQYLAVINNIMNNQLEQQEEEQPANEIPQEEDQTPKTEDYDALFEDQDENAIQEEQTLEQQDLPEQQQEEDESKWGTQKRIQMQKQQETSGWMKKTQQFELEPGKEWYFNTNKEEWGRTGLQDELEKEQEVELKVESKDKKNVEEDNVGTWGPNAEPQWESKVDRRQLEEKPGVKLGSKRKGGRKKKGKKGTKMETKMGFQPTGKKQQQQQGKKGTKGKGQQQQGRKNGGKKGMKMVEQLKAKKGGKKGPKNGKQPQMKAKMGANKVGKKSGPKMGGQGKEQAGEQPGPNGGREPAPKKDAPLDVKEAKTVEAKAEEKPLKTDVDELVLNKEKGEEVEDEGARIDSEYMLQAVSLAQPLVGEKQNYAPFPRPVAAAIIVTKDGRVIGKGVSTCNHDCVFLALTDAGVVATPLREWCVAWPHDRKLRDDMASATLYVTLEPSCERRGEALPPTTQLIENVGLSRVVIGCQNPVEERATEGAAALHSADITVSMGVEQEACKELIKDWAYRATTKLQRLARRQLMKVGRPLGFLHCSVIDSNDATAFARNGNAFGKAFGGHILSERDFGAYELAPPPESIWAADGSDDEDTDSAMTDSMVFEEEEELEVLNRSPMMPWYEQVDAVVATFPKAGNGPDNDDSVVSRLNGLKWLATHGRALPSGVERILVLDATDLVDLPLTNDDPNLPPGVNVEAFWEAKGRKPTRLLLRKSSNAVAEAAARSAAEAAAAAAEAARLAMEAVESGDAEEAAESAIKCQEAAVAKMQFIQRDVESFQVFRNKLTKLGVVVETIKGSEPVDVMNHIGRKNGYKAIVWRAGCWGERGVRAILDGAFQWVSAHLAVDAVGGKFWQLMLAERAIQAACGPEQKVKIFAEQEDFSLQYCDSEMADKDCVLTVDGRPIRHVRVDARVALVDMNRPRELRGPKTEPLKKSKQEEAPWFI